MRLSIGLSLFVHTKYAICFEVRNIHLLSIYIHSVFHSIEIIWKHVLPGADQCHATHIAVYIQNNVVYKRLYIVRIILRLIKVWKSFACKYCLWIVGFIILFSENASVIFYIKKFLVLWCAAYRKSLWSIPFALRDILLFLEAVKKK